MNAGINSLSSRIPLVDAKQHGGKTKSLWGSNCKRWSFEFSVEPSMICVYLPGCQDSQRNFFFLYLQLYCSVGIQFAFPRERQLQQNCSIQPTVHAGCFSVSIINQTLTRITGSLTCAQMLMHAIAHKGLLTL